MDRYVRKITMATAKSTTRRGFLSTLARGVVGAGLGAGFLFGGQRFALANNCTTEPFSSCPGLSDPCPLGDLYGCSNIVTCTGCSSGDCPSGYSTMSSWSCCCGGATYRCKTCSSSGTNPPDCKCMAHTGYC